MHKLYITDGIVLGKRGLGEANALVVVLTRGHGLLRAHARSSRVERSKLRYGLETLSEGRFTFVRGRRDWRLTGVKDVRNDFRNSDAAMRRSAGRIARLLLRLIHGEEISSALYVSVIEGLHSLVRAGDKNTVENIEALLVLRILFHLGYLPDTEELRPFVEADFFSYELASKVEASRKMLIKAINESLSATGL